MEMIIVTKKIDVKNNNNTHYIHVNSNMPKYRILTHKLLLINKIIKQRDLASLLKKNLVHLQFQKILVVSDPKILDKLFKYLATVTSFHHIKFNGLHYYETGNMWESYNIKKRPPYDPDTECNEYRRCKRKPTIYATINDRIKYILKFDYSEKNILSKKDKKYNELVLQILPYKLKNVLLIGFDKLIIKNGCGPNNDHRGSDHCNVFLPMHNKVNIKKYGTLYNLAIAYYKLKSHKWDNHYEMFSGSKTVIHEGNVKVTLDFDHGS
jgi:hypothetical protein